MIAWSYSSLSQFETCPKQYYHLRVLKDFKDKPWEHRAEGERVHKALEERCRDGKPLPPDLIKMEPTCARITNTTGEILVEQEIALDINLQRVKWFDKSTWVRAKIDLAVVGSTRAAILDWKTGKKRPESDQLRLFAAVAMAVYPRIKNVTTGFVWCADTPFTDESVTLDTFSRDDFMQLWGDYVKRSSRIETAMQTNVWQPKPSGLCRKHCPVTSCAFHGGS